MKFVKKPWGREVIIENNEKYCGKILEIKKGERLSKQYHKKKDETLFVYSGEVKVYLDHEEYLLKEGQSIRLRPGDMHRVEAFVDSKIIEISTHHDDADTVRLEDDYNRIKKK